MSTKQQFAEYYSRKYDMPIKTVLRLLDPGCLRGTLHHCYEAWEEGQKKLDLDGLKQQLADVQALNVKQHNQIMRLVAEKNGTPVDEWQALYKESDLALAEVFDGN